MNSTTVWRIFSFVVMLGMIGVIMPNIMTAQGQSAVPFLLIAPNARADGMGEAGGALADDGAAAYWNPAGLAFQNGQELSITHSNWLPQFQLSDLFYEFLSYKNHIDDWGGTMAASIIYLSLGEFNITGEGGPQILGTFKAYEVAATVGYAIKASNDVGLGINLRYIRSSLADFNVQDQQRKGVASGVSFDIATLWKPTGFLDDRLSIGVNLSNLGPKLTYIDADQADPLPTNIRLAFAGQVIKSEFNSVTLILDFSRLLTRYHPQPTDSLGNAIGDAQPPDPLPKSLITAWGDGGLRKVDISAGMEYWYSTNGQKLFAIRMGYFYEDPDYGNRKFMTFGAGIRYDVYGFDFSYLSATDGDSPLAETLRFSLSIAWGGKQD